ncbi:hypothetical protein BH23ACT11_BH23ACT11_27480 [soil metagenome]
MNRSKARAARPGARGISGRRPPSRKQAPRILLLLIVVVAVLLIMAVGIVFMGRSFGGGVSGKAFEKETLTTGPKPRLQVANGRGAIRVEGVNSLDSVEIELTKYALGSGRQEARKRASELSVNTSKRGSRYLIESAGGRDTGADFAIRTPQGSSIELESEAGDVELVKVHGDVTVSNEAGDVRVKGSKGSVEIRSLQGDVEISDVSTDTGQVDVDVGVGDAILRDLVVGTLDLRVDIGDAILSGRFSGGGEAVVQTGDIIVRLPSEDTRELSLESRIGDVVAKPDKPGKD